MLAAENHDSAGRPVRGVDNDEDSGVPLSERGKGEAMPMDKRHPIWVFAIVGLTFFLLLLAAVLVIMTYLNVTSSTP
ncbi:MAG: hypothetical protein KDA72_03845 [Planctomycetales bacterium]|nr:hypothetical protein [Planctomycetales bacterium]